MNCTHWILDVCVPIQGRGMLIKDQRSAPTSCDSRLGGYRMKKKQDDEIMEVPSLFATALFLLVSTAFLYFKYKYSINLK